MKKLFYLLLLTPIIYLASCSKSNVAQQENINDDNIEEIIVGKTWKLLNLDEAWFILNNDNTYLTKDYQCDSLEQNGTWQIKESVLSFTYIIGPLEYIERFTIVEYNDSIVKVNADTSATLDINIIFEIVPEGWGIFGCMNPDYANYNPEAVCPAPCNQGGCMDPIACNYNPIATYDDGSCQLPDGCTDSSACNYDPTAICDDGSCQLPDGCTDPIACNYDPTATCDDGSCQLPDGCTDPSACNYNPTATCDDGSCLTIYGCTDPNSFNYDPNAECDDGSCFYLAIGDTYQGGIVFYLDGNGGGLIAAPSDHPNSVQWGCTGTVISGADGSNIGTGAQNTVDILAGCNTPGIAADICANLNLGGYSDWFLPSHLELHEMYFSIGGLNNAGHWSSTENTQTWNGILYNNALYIDNNGVTGNTHKDVFNYVRAVRAF